MRAAAVIVAGGTGQRFGRSEGKQVAILDGRPLLHWATAAMVATPGVGLVVIVAPPERAAHYREIAEEATGTPVVLAPSGSTRQDSVRSGLAAVPVEFEFIAIHDGARPLLETALVSACLTRLAEDDSLDGVVVGQPAVDTVKRVGDDGIIADTPERAGLWTVQTPQVFRAPVIRRAHERAALTGYEATDDAALVEHAGGRVAVLESPRTNIKVTMPEDLEVAEALLHCRRDGS